MQLFPSLDSLIDLPFSAFEKKLTKLEDEFKNISVTDIDDEELEWYFLRIKNEYEENTGDPAKTRLEIIGYLSHFDVLVEKFFPDYVSLFQSSLERKDATDLSYVLLNFLRHMDEILREYTHRLSEPDQYPSYTGYIQELIQNSMIDLFFWLQDREWMQEKKAKPEDRNTDLSIKTSSETKDPKLQLTRQCLEILLEWVLEKIFFDHEYKVRTSPIDTELSLIGRYEKK